MHSEGVSSGGDFVNEEMRGKAIEALRELLQDNRDSLDYGTAGKGGNVKIYGDYSRPEEFRKKIDSAFDVRAYAQQKGEKINGGV